MVLIFKLLLCKIDSVFRPDSAALQMLIQQNAEMKEQLRVVTAMLQDILRRVRSAARIRTAPLEDCCEIYPGVLWSDLTESSLAGGVAGTADLTSTIVVLAV
jgi:hypothetical protein